MNRKLNPVKIKNQKYEMIPNADNISINHKVHKEITQRSQRSDYWDIYFVYFVFYPPELNEGGLCVV